ncbi:MAG: carboxylesterase family protein [Oscillospiraceae bacterium]|nr:carboxylesterase family protein [Oscillospiraceae bacterium]
MEKISEGTVLRQTALGAVRGNEREDCLEFLGLPYAHAARFAYASLTEHWEGEQDGTRFGPACPQNRAWHEHMEDPSVRFYRREFREGSSFIYSEDCLNLNIYTPKQAENCPVVIFFHGGSFDSGSNCENPFDGAALARQGIIIVFANYRLGVLGWLTHADLERQNGCDGNFGLDDQLTAIRWVRTHIGDFGGDGGNITLLGQSAGAMAIQYHCLNRENAGLFRRAAMMSGAGLFPRFSLPRRAEDTRAYWLDYMNAARCRSLDELREASLETLFGAVEELRNRRRDSLYNTMPVVDGRLIPAPVDVLMRDPLSIEYLLGFTNNDMYAPLLAFIGTRFARKNNAFTYFFDLDAPGDKSGAFHSSDLRYIFGTLDRSWRPYDGRDREVSGQMIRYLANFACSGSPNGPGLPFWKRGAGALCFAREKTEMGHADFLRLACNAVVKGSPKA